MYDKRVKAALLVTQKEFWRWKSYLISRLGRHSFVQLTLHINTILAYFPSRMEGGLFFLKCAYEPSFQFIHVFNYLI